MPTEKPECSGIIHLFIPFNKKMRTVLAVLIVLFCSSCGKPSAVSKKLSGSDSLVITFNMPNSDSVRGMVNTTGKNAIRKLTHFLEGKNTMEYKCGYNGSMI